MKGRPSRNPVVSEEMTYAFCRSRGRDPFDIMSFLSTCVHCKGTGIVKIICATCGGRGSISQSLQPTVSCPVCKGSGDDASAPAIACLKCGGKGLIIEQDRKGNGIHD